MRKGRKGKEEILKRWVLRACLNEGSVSLSDVGGERVPLFGSTYAGVRNISFNNSFFDY